MKDPPRSIIRNLVGYRTAGASLYFLCIAICAGMIVYILYIIYGLQTEVHWSLKCFLLTIFIAIAFLHRKERQAAHNAQQGAIAEERVFLITVDELESQGWSFLYNEKLTDTWDIDIVAYSPSGNTYIIDVKSHRGTKVVTPDGIYRRYGHNIYEFKKDLLKGARSQAARLRSRDNLRWVTPFLCFTEGTVEYQTGEISSCGVCVVRASDLVETLLQCERSKR